MTRSDLYFHNLAGSFPNDRSLVLTQWQLAGSPHPATGEGQIHDVHIFDGNAGYECFDVSEDYRGLLEISVRCVVFPDYVALNGTGRITLVARGSGSLLDVNETHPWGFGIRVTGGTVLELIGYSQDNTFTITEVIIGSVPVPSDTSTPLTLGFTRTVERDQATWRAYVNGFQVGEQTGTLSIVSVPDTTILSIGYRDNAGVPAELYEGRIEFVTIQDHETIDTEESAEHQARVKVLDTLERLGIQTIAPLRPAAFDPQSVFHRRKIRPKGFGLGDIWARTNAVQKNMIFRPFGDQLDLWLKSTGIDVLTQGYTTEKKLLLLNGLLADQGGSEVSRYRQIVANLTQSDVADVDALENINQLAVPTATVSTEIATGPWEVQGNGDVDMISTGIRLQAKGGRDLGWDPRTKPGLQATLPIEHFTYQSIDEDIGPEDGQKTGFYGFGFAATLVSLVNTFTSTEWAGFVVEGRTSLNAPIGPWEHKALFVGIYGAGPNHTLAVASANMLKRGQLMTGTQSPFTSWTTLGTIAAGQQLSIEYNDESRGNNGPEFTVRVHHTPWDTTDTIDEYPIALDSDYKMPIVTRMGLCIHSNGPLSSGLKTIVWDDCFFHYPRAATGKSYFLVADMANIKDHSAHTNVIRSNDRPSTRGHVTYYSPLETGNVDGPHDYTPAKYLDNYPLALPDYKNAATRLTGILAYSLWTFQDSGLSTRDRMGRDTFAEITSANILWQQAGPDGRNAMRIDDDSIVDYLSLFHSSLLDFSSVSDMCWILVYRYDPVAPAEDHVIVKTNSAGSKQIRLDIQAGNFTLYVDDGIATTAQVQVPVTTGAWDAVAFTVENTVGTTYRLTLANRSTNATVTQALGGSLSTDTPWDIGGRNGRSARITYRWLMAAIDLEANNLSGATLQDVCNRVYGSAFGG